MKAVYSAIAHLRAEGRVVSVASVSQLAGVARSTFYQDTDDWYSVLTVIDGGEIPTHVVVERTSSNNLREPSRIRVLEKKVSDLEKELKETIFLADETYQRLIDQLQYYFALAHETPSRQEDIKRQRIELTEAYEEITRLKREVKRLVGEGRPSNVFSAKGRKRHISIPPGLSVAKAADHFFAELYRHIPDKGVGQVFTSITFVCGLPLSGKSSWITRQSPQGPGSSLFIEGSLHTEEIRSLLLGHVRRVCQADVRCVWLLTTMDTCIRRIAPSDRAPSSIDELIRTINAATQQVSLSEAFDSIVGIR